MARFRKKPVVVEAVQLNWRNWSEVCDFLGPVIGVHNPGRNVDDFSDDCGEQAPYIELTIPTREGDHTVKHGDWIIRGTKDELYPCKPDIFAEIYDPV